jgi:aspartyl-tRNA(Asn)/glutamyl-tRNA(Gln) amidotransferase subunit A
MSDESRIGCLHQAFRRREISPVGVARAQLDAIAALDRDVNAFCHVDAHAVLAMAKQSERRYRDGEPLSPMDGVPVSVKDTINVAGWPTRRGSRTSSPDALGEDAIAVARLRAAGAVFIGKTTTPEFAWKGVTDSPLCGVTRNPLDLALTAGGSSGGASAATALGLGVMALGTDAAGSVRIPAAFCGVVGFKPTLGRIPLDPYAAGFSQLPHIGPITATVADAEISTQIMAGPAVSDWTSFRHTKAAHPESTSHKNIGSLRIGIAPLPAETSMSGDIVAAWQSFLSAIADHVADIREVDLPFHGARDVTAMLYRIGCAEAVARVPPNRHDELDAELIDFIAPVKLLSPQDIIALYRRREDIANQACAVLYGKIDVFVSPTMVVAPPRIDDLSRGSVNWLDWNLFTPLFNLCQGPAISVPWRNDRRLPIGIQVAAAPGNDELVFVVARIVERLSGYSPSPLALAAGTAKRTKQEQHNEH